MYSLLHDLLSDQKTDVVFFCFGPWHILYMFVIFASIFALICYFKHKEAKTKQRVIRVTISVAFGLYILDFFLMPFAYGHIDLEKLPFHFCTALCVLCYLSRHTRFFEKFRTQFALLGLVSNLIYVIYPAGVGWYQIGPASYRVVQTLLFHGTMTAYGLFCLAFGDIRLSWKNCFKELPVILVVTAWALLGNTLYNGTSGEYAHFFNWSFVIRDPFYLLPETIAPYVMPFVIIVVYFVAEMLIYAAYAVCKKYIPEEKYES